MIDDDGGNLRDMVIEMSGDNGGCRLKKNSHEIFKYKARCEEEIRVIDLKNKIFSRNCHQDTKYSAAKISHFGSEIKIQILKSNPKPRFDF